MLANSLLHPVVEHEVYVEEYSVLSWKSASECCRITVMSKLVPTLFLP